MNAIKPIVGAMLVAGIAVPMFLQHQALGALRNENAALTERSSQLDAIRAENARLAKLAVDHDELVELRKEHSDLMRLRGEWTLMRDQIAMLEGELKRQRALLAAKGASEEELLSSEEREARRQVLIESHVVEVPTNSRIWQEFGLRPPASGEDGGLFSAMQDSVAARMIERMKETEGTDVLAAPRVTTLNGRQSQISSTSLKTVLTGVLNDTVTTEQLAFGPVIDFLPKFEKDGTKIAMDVKFHMKQLIEPDATPSVAHGQSEEDFDLPTEFRSMPIVQDRNMEATFVLNPGQVMVMSGGYSAGRQMISEDQESVGPTGLLVIISPREIDRAGNWVVPIGEGNETPVSQTVLHKADHKSE